MAPTMTTAARTTGYIIHHQAAAARLAATTTTVAPVRQVFLKARPAMRSAMRMKDFSSERTLKSAINEVKAELTDNKKNRLQNQQLPTQSAPRALIGWGLLG